MKGFYKKYPSRESVVKDKHGKDFPSIPTCPGPYVAKQQLNRPPASKYFRSNHEKEARIYEEVRRKKMPNYRGAKLLINEKLPIQFWRKKIHKRIGSNFSMRVFRLG